MTTDLLVGTLTVLMVNKLLVEYQDVSCYAGMQSAGTSVL